MDGMFKIVPKIVIILIIIPPGYTFSFFSDDPPPPHRISRTRLPTIFLQDWPMIKLSLMDNNTVMAGKIHLGFRQLK